MSHDQPKRAANDDCFATGPSLTRERSRADANIERERDLIDRALATLSEAPNRSPSALLELRDRVRATLVTARDKWDCERSEDRSATDGVLRDAQQSHRDVVDKLSRDLQRARAQRDDDGDTEGAHDRRSRALALSTVILELDAIGVAANAIRSEVDVPRARMDTLTYEIQASTWHVLELVDQLAPLADDTESRGRSE